jgi:outer membrane protein insertion porin family
MVLSHTAHRLFPLIAACYLLALSACNVTKHLDHSKGERLLVKNSLAVKGEKRLSLSEKAALQYELGAMYRQQPNRKSFLVFINLQVFYERLWLYYKYHDKQKGLGKRLTKKIVEPPSVFNPILTSRTALNFENVMRQRGYLQAQCDYVLDTIGQYKMAVKYNLNLGPLYTLDTIRFRSRDSLVLQILNMTSGDCRLKGGQALDGRAFDTERLRITSELKNRGYAYFTPNFIEFNGDSSGTRTNVYIDVLTPTDTSIHQVYKLGNIGVFSSLVPDYSLIRNDTMINGVYFYSSEPKFVVKPQRLIRAIALEPSWPYRQVDFDQTLRNLSALGVFKFVSVKPFQDSLNPENINVAVSYTPYERYSMGADVDVNYSSNQLSGGLIGLSSSASFRNRNLFRGAEQLQTNLQANVEFDVTNPNRLIFSQEFKFQNELVLPRFFDYFGFWRTAHALRVGKSKIVTRSLYDRMRNEAQAHISLNYNYLQQTDFFIYNLFNASFGYEIHTNPEHQYTFDHIGIDVLRPRFDPKFEPSVSEFLRLSFGKQLFTGFIMRSFSYNYSSKQNRFGERWQVGFNSELSGFEEMLVHKLWSAAFGPETWKIADLEFAKFLRLDLNVVYTREFRKDLIGALHLGVGAAAPFAETGATPYVKQFFVGGPSSIRAWRIRELGPGGHKETNLRENQPFFQAGDFRFEFNGELRFPFFWWFKGAVFVDGGNVYTLRPDNRSNARLHWDSYKNFAIGTGFGIRADFDYFILRLDWGLKLRRPYADENAGYWLINRWKQAGVSPFNFNLAVGYPF